MADKKPAKKAAPRRTPPKAARPAVKGTTSRARGTTGRAARGAAKKSAAVGDAATPKQAPDTRSAAAGDTATPKQAPDTRSAAAGDAATPKQAPDTTAAARRRPSRRAIHERATSQRALHAVPDAGQSAGDQTAPPPSAADTTPSPHLPLDPADIVDVLVGLLRSAGSATGLEGDDLERRVAQTLAFLRRRLTGDYEIDAFGFDPEFTEEVWLPMLRPLYQRWFRVEVRGVENLPADSGALVVANHSGTLPVDGLMVQVAVHDEHPRHRFVRSLGADLIFQSPVVGEYARKSGVTLAANPDAERLLRSGEVALVFPEGFKGIGKPFRERYRLQRFGRGGFVTSALRTGAPIVPCSIVGAEEIYPKIGNLGGLARMLGFPYFPVTPTFPLLGPLGLVPLPSKWIIEFGEPIETASHGKAAAEDPMVVLELSDQVRETIQQTLHELLRERKSVFF